MTPPRTSGPRWPLPRTFHRSPAAAAIGGKFYLVNGRGTQGEYWISLEVFDPATGAWTTLVSPSFGGGVIRRGGPRRPVLRGRRKGRKRHRERPGLRPGQRDLGPPTVPPHGSRGALGRRGERKALRHRRVDNDPDRRQRGLHPRRRLGDQGTPPHAARWPGGGAGRREAPRHRRARWCRLRTPTSPTRPPPICGPAGPICRRRASTPTAPA